jgi:hypothetical protein
MPVPHAAVCRRDWGSWGGGMQAQGGAATNTAAVATEAAQIAPTADQAAPAKAVTMAAAPDAAGP